MTINALYIENDQARAKSFTSLVDEAVCDDITVSIASASEAIAAINSDTFDLAICSLTDRDIAQKIMQEIRSDFESVPIILLGYNCTRDDVKFALGEGAIDVLDWQTLSSFLLWKAAICAVGNQKRNCDREHFKHHNLESNYRSSTSLLADVSHEIRTPLNSLIGMADLLGETLLSEDQKLYVQSIAAASNQLLLRVNDILDFSKLESGNTRIDSREFEIESVVSEVCKILSVKARQKNTNVSYYIDENAPSHIKGDPSRLSQVLMNLLGNSIKFTENGEATINVKLTQNQDDGRGLLRFRVSDTGVGMGPEQLEHIFEPFTQADNSISGEQGGTGLGLSIVKHLVGLMQGEVSVTSIKGTGSKFTFTIPFDSDDAKFLNRGERDLCFSGKSLLLIDQNNDQRHTVSQIVSNLGCKVEAFSNFREALVHIDAHRDHIDAYLIDAKSIGEDASSLQELTDRGLMLKTVLIVPAMQNRNQIDQARALGIHHYVWNPIEPAKLVQSLENILKTNYSDVEEETGTVLVVDDDDSICEILEFYLNEIGIPSISTTDPTSVSSMLANHPISVVLTDNLMPKLSGLELFKSLKITYHNIPFVLMTGEGNKQLVIDALREGIFDYIEKPFTVEDVGPILRKALLASKQTQKSPKVQSKSSVSLPELDILVVEDTDEDRFVFSTYFKDTPFKCTFVHSGLDAINEFDRQQFDLILMDLNLPGVDGFEATEKIRAIESEKGIDETPIIAVTTFSDDDKIQRANAAGCNHYLLKPISKSQLLSAILKFWEDLKRAENTAA